MPTIKQLNSTTSLSDADNFVVYSTTNGDTRKVSLTSFLKYLVGKFSVLDVNTKLSITKSIYTATSIGGTNNAQSFTTDNLLGLSAIPILVWVIPVLTNTGPMTITIDDNSLIPLYSPMGNPLNNAEFVTGVPYLLIVTNTYAKIFTSGATF
jgi:hypothetical protein